MPRRYLQLDVFAARVGTGNPLGVVFDAGDMDTAAMQSLAAWLNLSETIFFLPPTTADADSIVTTRTPWPVLSTSTTCKPSRPTSRSQWSQYEGVVEAQQHPVGSDTSRPSGQVEETLPILKASTPNHPHPALRRVALTPTSRLKSLKTPAQTQISP